MLFLFFALLWGWLDGEKAKYGTVAIVLNAKKLGNRLIRILKAGEDTSADVDVMSG